MHDHFALLPYVGDRHTAEFLSFTPSGHPERYARDNHQGDHYDTIHYANLIRQLRSQGTPIPTNDLWIAALAIEHDLILLSRDTHFRHLPQIERRGSTNRKDTVAD